MNNSFYIKLVIFLIIEIIGFGLIFKNQEIAIFGIFTAIALGFLFLDPKLIGDKSNIKDKFKETHYETFLQSEFYQFLKYFFLHWGFVISLIILMLAILDRFVLNFFDLNIVMSIIFFIISLSIVYKDLMEGKIYLGNQEISSKDVLFIMSLILSLSLFVFLKKIDLIDKVFFSILGGFVFYLSMVYSLDYNSSNMKLFKSKIIVLYMLLFIASSSLFAYTKIQQKFNENKKETDIIAGENNDDNTFSPQLDEGLVENETFITYTAPNDKLYDIYITTTGAWFLGYNAEKKYYENVDEAKFIIDKYNPLLTGESLISSGNNQQLTGDTTNPQSLIPNPLNEEQGKTNEMIDTLIDMFEEEDTVEEKEAFMNSLNLDEEVLNNLELEDEDTTYYDAIPFIVDKFNLVSSSKPNIDFDNISKDDENYEYFKTAYYNKMIGRNFNPNSSIQCKTFAVFIGLAENPNTTYTSSNVFDIFWNQVNEKYNISQCCKGEDVLKKSKITCILK